MEHHDTFVGLWRLVSFEQRISGATTHLFGRHASGIIAYDAAGMMSVHIVRDPMARFSAPAESAFDPLLEPPYSGEAASSSRDDLEAVFESYLAYFGPYSVDWAAKRVTHNVEGSNRPGFVNRKLVRAFEFSGDLLRLSPPAEEESPVTLVWRRLAG
jgi:hypothetical protein